MAFCAMTGALCVVLLLLGGIVELGMYAMPMLAGLAMIPAGERYGRSYQAMVWVTVSVLAFLLVPQVEENLLFFAFFGWYPMVRPRLQRLPRLLRVVCKALCFNLPVALVETLVMLVLVPQAMEPMFLGILLAMANVTFWLYDFVVPRFDVLLGRIFPGRPGSKN